eukprot:3938278-Rhodomonas_salina.1
MPGQDTTNPRENTRNCHPFVTRTSSPRTSEKRREGRLLSGDDPPHTPSRVPELARGHQRSEVGHDCSFNGWRADLGDMCVRVLSVLSRVILCDVGEAFCDVRVQKLFVPTSGRSARMPVPSESVPGRASRSSRDNLKRSAGRESAWRA